MKKPQKRKYSEESYWKTATDVMAGILMAVLLIMMLLLLYVTQIRHENEIDPYPGTLNEEVSYTQRSDHYEDERKKEDKTEDSSTDGGGGEYPESSGNQEGKDKAAVHVSVVDEDSGAVIKTPGIMFELYGGEDGSEGMKVLNTYYPNKIEYKQYETTSNGTFYLPEKIEYGKYALRNLKLPDGYNAPDYVNFEVRGHYDWNEPLQVEVPLSPIKNNIHIQTEDSETKQPVPGGVYGIYAAENLLMSDGTVRYRSGDKLGEITCDEKGYGESSMLYIGKYTLKQKTPQHYYALNYKSIPVEISNTNLDVEVYRIPCEKTAVSIRVIDEYDNEPIPDVVFTNMKNEESVTDENGIITFTDLEKNMKYTYALKKLPEPYRNKSADISFTVDETGRLRGGVKTVIDKKVYVTRLSVDVMDILFRYSIPNHKVTVSDENGHEISSWVTSGNEKILKGLAEGNYVVTADAKDSSGVRTVISDSGKLQNANVYVWTLWDTVAVAAVGLLLAAVVWLIVFTNRRRKERKKDGQ